MWQQLYMQDASTKCYEHMHSSGEARWGKRGGDAGEVGGKAHVGPGRWRTEIVKMYRCEDTDRDR